MSVPPDQMPGGPKSPQTPSQAPQQPISGGMPGMEQVPQEPGNPLPPADPESRKLGAKAIENMLDVMYGDDWPNLISELSETDKGRLPETVGRIVATMYILQEAYARAAGKELPQEIAVDVGRQMVEEMYTIMSSQEIYEAPNEQTEQQEMAKALMYAAKYYRMHLESEGRFDEQKAMQLGQAVRSGAYDQPGAAPGSEGDGTAAPPAGMPQGGQGGGVQEQPANLLDSARQAARGNR